MAKKRKEGKCGERGNEAGKRRTEELGMAVSLHVQCLGKIEASERIQVDRVMI